MSKPTAKTVSQELDPKITALLLKGLAADIEDGKVEPLALEKIPYRGATTLVIHYQEQKKS